MAAGAALLGGNTLRADEGGAVLQKRDMPLVTVTGSGHQRGVEHGKQLRQPIRRLMDAWFQTIREKCGQEPKVFMAEFLRRFDFLPAVEQWTPDLLAEVRGIAEGSGVSFGHIFALQLFNDEFWLNANAMCGNRCSAIGVRGRAAAFVAQNMDLRGMLEGFQAVLRVRDASGFEAIVFTHAGSIALTGMNQAGIGVAVNALTQLRWAGSGLPVAFVTRGMLARKSYREAVAFLRRVPHATGQNYIVGAPDALGSFEASVGGVAEYVPPQGSRAILHTNHPLSSTDFRPGYDRNAKETNSRERMASLEAHIAGAQPGREADSIRLALRAKDSPMHPVCRPFKGRQDSFTFGSVIFELWAQPKAWIASGPPDAREYHQYGLGPV